MKPKTARASEFRAGELNAGLLLDNQLCFALYAASLAMTKVYRPILRPLGLTYPQYVVMLALWDTGKLSAGSLGERVALDSGTLAPLVRKLKSRGLVERNRNPLDERSVLIALTSRGASLAKRARSVNEQVACATQFTEAQIETLTRSLRRLRASLIESANS